MALVLLEARRTGGPARRGDQRVAVARPHAVELDRAAGVGIGHVQRIGGGQIRLPGVVSGVVGEVAVVVRRGHTDRHGQVVRDALAGRDAQRHRVHPHDELAVPVVEVRRVAGCAEGRGQVADAGRAVERVHPAVEVHRVGGDVVQDLRGRRRRGGDDRCACE